MTRRPPRLPDADRQSIIDTAHALAEVARTATLRHFRADGLTATSKETRRYDPVTVADRESETAMRALLAARRPDDGVLGEEFPATPGTSGLTWVLDPIDGTRGFLSGTPTWGVLISVADAEGPIFGIIDQPYIGERFSGGLGLAEVTGPMGTHPLRARPARPLDEAILFTTFPEVGTVAEGAAFRRVSEAARLTRYGMDCYAYALVAAGQIDLVIEAGLQAYDVQAPIAVIEAAGGIVTDWRGQPVHQGGQVLAAANTAIHAAALALLAPA
jgi:histidinol phosphatase-like enzyme (inositol monophosphatase family)